jgi:hypothetical protein
MAQSGRQGRAEPRLLLGVKRTLGFVCAAFKHCACTLHVQNFILFDRFVFYAKIIYVWALRKLLEMVRRERSESTVCSVVCAGDESATEAAADSACGHSSNRANRDGAMSDDHRRGEAHRMGKTPAV